MVFSIVVIVVLAVVAAAFVFNLVFDAAHEKKCEVNTDSNYKAKAEGTDE